MSRITSLFRNLFRRGVVEQQLDDELSAYFDALVEEKTAAGMTEAEARRAVRMELGEVDRVKEAVRDIRTGAALEQLGRDALHGLRILRRNPGFTVVSLVTLALGIGLNTAFFSVVSAVFLRPLPYEDPDNLLYITLVTGSATRAFVPAATYLAWNTDAHAFQSMAAFADHYCDGNLTGAQEPERVNRCVGVTASFFGVLGVTPEVGRSFLREEGQLGGPRALILGHSFWRTRFGADPRIVGTTLTLGGEGYNVVGVMPSRFEYPGGMTPQVLVPLVLPNASAFGAEDLRRVEVIGRLRPGVAIEQARESLSSASHALERAYPASVASWLEGAEPKVLSLRDELVGSTRSILLVLFTAVGSVLLIACANVSNLLLARASARRKEFALRAALGATRFRLARQLLAEAVLLAGIGAMAGILLAFGMTRLVRSIGPESIPQLRHIQIDMPVLAFVAFVTMVTALLCSLAPILLASQKQLLDAVKEGSGTAGPGREGQRIRTSLVVVEFALSLVLLAGAGLLLRSFGRVLNVDPGFDPSNVLTFQVTLTETRYPRLEQRKLFFQGLLERVGRLPGVEAVGATRSLPLHYGFSRQEDVLIGGHAEPCPIIPVVTVSPDYFRTMRIPLKTGRYFTDGDQERTPPVAIVNQAFERRCEAGGGLNGRTIRLADTGAAAKDYLVVGVVGDVRHFGREEETSPAVFTSYLQFPRPALTIAVWTTDSRASGLLDAVRREVRAIDRDQPLYDVATMDQRLAGSLSVRRFDTSLLATFAGVALAMAAIGLYGVTSYWVGQRRREIGLRIALGAERRGVVALVVRQAMVVAARGCARGWSAPFCGRAPFGRSCTTPA